MKRAILISIASILLYCICIFLLMNEGRCSNKDERPMMCADVICDDPYRGFIETYRKFFTNYQEERFFVKGVVTDVDGVRMEIKILEALNGYLKKSSSITFWCDPWEHDYVANDTLLIIMRRINSFSYQCYHGIKRDHYEQLPCAYSILSLSKGYATGVINTDDKVISMPWNELQKLLKINKFTSKMRAIIYLFVKK